jgi:hypothetical protein
VACTSARLAQRQLPEGAELRRLKLKVLNDDVFVTFEPQQLYEATKEAGKRNDSAAPGQMRMVEEINPQNGHKIIKWLGTRSFIHDFKSPVRFVRSFWSEQGRVTTSRGYLR